MKNKDNKNFNVINTDRIVLLDREKGYMIWDTIEESFIGFILGHTSSKRRKGLWSTIGHAKLPLNFIQGVLMTNKIDILLRRLNERRIRFRGY
jgi:hypothetical protein